MLVANPRSSAHIPPQVIAMQAFEQQLAADWPPRQWQDVGVVLAVSGGADSVALAQAMRGLKTCGAGRLELAHFNHQLRGRESDDDQEFVMQMADGLGLPCTLGAPGPGQLVAGGEGLEAQARAARYQFLQRTAEAAGARYVVTAHTADDQAETVLHHVLRGTGLAGLTGMQRTRPLGPAATLIRPMLAISRREVLDYLSYLGQTFREDATNQDRQFMRNRIRHDLLPLLKQEYAPGVVESLLRLGKLAAAAQQVVAAAAEQLADRAVTVSRTDELMIACPELADAERHLVREMLVTVWQRQGWPLAAMGFAEWQALAEMTCGDRSDAKRMFPGAVTAHRRGEKLTLSAAPT
jgi:tRNA(Ile)-lysidine synthase